MLFGGRLVLISVVGFGVVIVLDYVIICRLIVVLVGFSRVEVFFWVFVEIFFGGCFVMVKVEMEDFFCWLLVGSIVLGIVVVWLFFSFGRDGERKVMKSFMLR